MEGSSPCKVYCYCGLLALMELQVDSGGDRLKYSCPVEDVQLVSILVVIALVLNKISKYTLIYAHLFMVYTEVFILIASEHLDSTPLDLENNANDDNDGRRVLGYPDYNLTESESEEDNTEEGFNKDWSGA
ncbi:unnamed protein product [Linum trigynum]|uniref:Uncharacterized protein n=1 Tax=Linum trigynum TaxID=586398 RepID=A0AAV2GAJ9_9ROSI